MHNNAIVTTTTTTTTRPPSRLHLTRWRRRNLRCRRRSRRLYTRPFFIGLGHSVTWSVTGNIYRQRGTAERRRRLKGGWCAPFSRGTAFPRLVRWCRLKMLPAAVKLCTVHDGTLFINQETLYGNKRLWILAENIRLCCRRYTSRPNKIA